MFKRAGWIIIVILILFNLVSCDNIRKCFPTVDVKDVGAGFKCTGEF